MNLHMSIQHRVCTDLMNEHFCWSARIGVSIRRNSLTNVSYDFVNTLPAVPSSSCSPFLEGWRDVRKVTVQLPLCWDLHAALLCSSYLRRSPDVSWKSNSCNHTIVLTLLKLVSISVFFLSAWSNFRNVVNLSIAVRMLTFLSVDETFLPWYINRSTNRQNMTK